MIGQIAIARQVFPLQIENSKLLYYIYYMYQQKKGIGIRYVLRTSTCSPTYKKSLLLSFCLHTYIHLVTLYLQELSHFDNYPYDASGQFLRVFYAFLSLAKLGEA